MTRIVSFLKGDFWSNARSSYVLFSLAKGTKVAKATKASRANFFAVN
jgi:hypothetical protein